MTDTMTANSLDREAEKVLDTIDKNTGISNSEISDITGFNPTKVKRKVDKLEERELVTDTAYKGNETSYKVLDNVEVTKNYRLESIFNYQMAAHALELTVIVIVLPQIPHPSRWILLLGFFIGWFPSLVHSLNYVLEENDLHELQVKVEETEED